MKYYITQSIIKIIKNIGIAVLLIGLLVLVSCQKDSLGDDSAQSVQTKISISVPNNNLTLRAVNDGDADNRVVSMRVMFIIPRTGLVKENEKITVVDGDPNPSVEIGIIEGTYDVVVICNEPPSMTATLDGVVNISALNTLSVDFDLLKDEPAIPMVGKDRFLIDRSTLVEENGKERVPIEMNVSRIVSRIKLTIYSKNDVGLLNSIQLSRFPKNIGLLDGTSGYSLGAGVTFTPDPKKFVNETATMTPNEKLLYQSKQTLEAFTVPSWLFNPATDAAKGIAVTAAFGDENLVVDGFVSYIEGTERRYTLQRNTIYNVIVVGGGGMGIAPPSDATHEDW